MLTKNTLFIIIVVIAIILFAVFFVCKKEYATACFSDNCFKVEIADSIIKKELGLMFRKQLGADQGMLFVFKKEDIYPFWMKNTLIPLDIIWLNNQKEIVFIAENTQTKNTQEITPDKPALYVLEINAGLTKTLGIKIGDKMEIK